jgi:hypothetical protein
MYLARIEMKPAGNPSFSPLRPLGCGGKIIQEPWHSCAFMAGTAAILFEPGLIKAGLHGWHYEKGFSTM